MTDSGETTESTTWQYILNMILLHTNRKLHRNAKVRKITGVVEKSFMKEDVLHFNLTDLNRNIYM